MKVLLVSPEFPDTFWSFKHALRFINRRAAFPPLGLLTVAALLPSEWPKRLVDLNVRSLTDRDLAWADAVFVGGMIAQRKSAREVLARAKAAGVRIVAGGPLFATDRSAYPEVDHFVLNEAEITLPKFLADLEAGRAGPLYQSEEYADLALSPAPLWELAELGRYASMSVQYTRGCPYGCDFCNVTSMFGHTPRAKSAAQVVTELDRLYGLGWRGHIFFVDDNLIGNKRILKADLLPALLAWQRGKCGISFSTQVSMNVADDPAVMRAMSEAGFTNVFVGIETPDEDALAGCNKKQNLKRDLVADVKRIQRAGLAVEAGFILGFDTDTPAAFGRQRDFIQKSGITTAMVGLLQAIPGTRLHARMADEGRIIGLSTGDNVDGTTNLVPRMGPEVLRDGYRTLLTSLYSPKLYYSRARTYLREAGVPRVKPRFSFSRLCAFFQASAELGIVRRERFHYWSLLGWTLTRRPRLLPQAVTLAIYGYHFRRVVESHIL